MIEQADLVAAGNHPQTTVVDGRVVAGEFEFCGSDAVSSQGRVCQWSVDSSYESVVRRSVRLLHCF